MWINLEIQFFFRAFYPAILFRSLCVSSSSGMHALPFHIQIQTPFTIDRTKDRVVCYRIAIWGAMCVGVCSWRWFELPHFAFGFVKNTNHYYFFFFFCSCTCTSSLVHSLAIPVSFGIFLISFIHFVCASTGYTCFACRWCHIYSWIQTVPCIKCWTPKPHFCVFSLQYNMCLT